jgi:hypothetical protein
MPLVHDPVPWSSLMAVAHDARRARGSWQAGRPSVFGRVVHLVTAPGARFVLNRGTTVDVGPPGRWLGQRQGVYPAETGFVGCQPLNLATFQLV